jgi:uncharacterized membrane protein
MRAAGAGGVFGFGIGGLADGIVLHQVLQWHHLISDGTTTRTVEGLEANTLADGLFHLATLLVVVVGTALLWRAAPGRGREVVGGTLVGWGVFNLVDEVVFHLLLDLHHIRMVEGYLAYDLAFAGIGVLLVLAGWRLLRRRSWSLRSPAPIR